MRREAERFATKLRAQLKCGSSEADAPCEAFGSCFLRARRFHAAWAQHDVPKQAQQAEEALRTMQRRLMQVHQRQAQVRADPQ